MKSQNLKKKIRLLIFFSVKPAAVHILAKRTSVSAEKTYDIECKSSGSKPAAVITWWRGTKQIKRPIRNVSFKAKKKSKWRCVLRLH